MAFVTFGGSLSMGGSGGGVGMSGAANREVERLRLEEECEDISAMELSLQRSAEISQRMVTILQGFDRRLEGLESSILPIHTATQKLTLLQENIQATLAQLESVLGYFDLAMKEDPLLRQATTAQLVAGSAEDLDRFLEAIDRVKQAMLYLQKARLKNHDRTLAQLRASLVKAITLLENVFKKYLLECAGVSPANIEALPPSTAKAARHSVSSKHRYSINSKSGRKPADGRGAEGLISAEEYASLFSIAPATFQNLIRMARYLAVLENDAELAGLQSGGTPMGTTHWRAVGDLRSSHLLSVLQSHAVSVRALVLPEKPMAGVYVKGSSPFLPYTKTLLFHIYYEWVFLQHLIPGASVSLSGPSALSRVTGKPAGTTSRMASVLETILSPALGQYRECIDLLVVRARKNAPGQPREMSIDFLVLDVAEMLLGQMDSKNLIRWQDALRLAGKKANEINDCMYDVSTTALQAFGEFLEDIRASTAKLPDDGTVHELSSSTLTYLKRLCEYLDTVEVLLPMITTSQPGDLWEYRPVEGEDKSLVLAKLLATQRQQQQKQHTGRHRIEELSAETDRYADSTMRKYCEEVLMLLLTNLEGKSRGYKKGAVLDKSTGKTILSSIFLLNNFHYVLKTLRGNSLLLEVVGKELEGRVENRMREEMSAYQQSWKPIVEHLLETAPFFKAGSTMKLDSAGSVTAPSSPTKPNSAAMMASPSSGVLPVSLPTSPTHHQPTKSEKQTIKDRFRNFNEGFEEAFRLQKVYAVPDQELRQQLVRDIKMVLMPMYTRFLDRYQKVHFTEHPEKYLKYTVSQLEEMLAKFFDPTAANAASGATMANNAGGGPSA